MKWFLQERFASLEGLVLLLLFIQQSSAIFLEDARWSEQRITADELCAFPEEELSEDGIDENFEHTVFPRRARFISSSLSSERNAVRVSSSSLKRRSAIRCHNSSQCSMRGTTLVTRALMIYRRKRGASSLTYRNFPVIACPTNHLNITL